jgi:hypothetical protein
VVNRERIPRRIGVSLDSCAPIASPRASATRDPRRSGLDRWRTARRENWRHAGKVGCSVLPWSGHRSGEISAPGWSPDARSRTTAVNTASRSITAGPIPGTKGRPRGDAWKCSPTERTIAEHEALLRATVSLRGALRPDRGNNLGRALSLPLSVYVGTRGPPETETRNQSLSPRLMLTRFDDPESRVTELEQSYP